MCSNAEKRFTLKIESCPLFSLSCYILFFSAIEAPCQEVEISDEESFLPPHSAPSNEPPVRFVLQCVVFSSYSLHLIS